MSITIEEVWPIIETDLNKIVLLFTSKKTNDPTNNGDKTEITNEEWFKLVGLVYKYCVKSPKSVSEPIGGRELYFKVRDFLLDFTLKIKKSIESLSGIELLHEYRNQYEIFSTIVEKFDNVFLYLNNNWVLKVGSKQDVYQIYNLGLFTWRENILLDVKDKITPILFQLIENDRRGEIIDYILLKYFISSFISFGLKEREFKYYLDLFEKDYLENTEIYYTKESSEFISSNTISDYLRKVNDRFTEETQRSNLYLHPSTYPKLMNALNSSLIVRHHSTLVTEANNFLQDDKIEDLKILYTFLDRVNLLSELQNIFEQYVIKAGCEAINEIASEAEKDPRTFFNAIIRIYKRTQRILKESFNSKTEFTRALDKSLRRFINDNSLNNQNDRRRGSKSPELLASFSDVVLRKNANYDDSEIETISEQIMVIFDYLEEKDRFMQYYRRKLSIRLIQAASGSEEDEKRMVIHFKTKAGFEFTTKLERMFKDMEISRDISDGYKNSDFNKSKSGDVSFTILSTGAWIIPESGHSFNLPPYLQYCETNFTNYYVKQHAGRKLKWVHNLSKGDILSSSFASSKGKNYTFHCSGFQIAVLMMFNESNSIIYTKKDVMLKTGLSSSQFDSTLKMLVKFKIILVENKKIDKNANEGLLPEDIRIQLNLKAFISKSLKVNCNKIEETKQDRQAQQVSIDADRNLVLQACIVRIMKMRKQLKHNELITNVLDQTSNKFKPSVSDIKKCIDILIEKEYLERVKDQKDVYQYLA